MNCPKCGSPVGKNDEYCGSCGYHLNTSGEEKPKKKKSGLMIFTIFLEVIAIVVIVGAIFFVVHGDKETKKDGGIQTEADLNSSEKKEKTDSSSNEGEDGKSDSSSNAVEQEGSDGTSDTENHAEPAPDGTAMHLQSLTRIWLEMSRLKHLMIMIVRTGRKALMALVLVNIWNLPLISLIL